MNFIDQSVSRENIKDNISLFKNLVRDLESDMKEQTTIKCQMNIYNSINNFENKMDRRTN